MIIADFRAQFPEFSDIVKYPDSQLTFWSSVAERMVNETVWQDMYDVGVKLYVAHEITLATQNLLVSSIGGTPGQNAGIVTSKAVGAVNASYDANTVNEKDAGWWNLSNYGRQFIHLARLFGSGATQL